MQADLLSHFKTLEDPRIDRTKRYPLIEIIFLIISATISGCEGWKSIRDFGLLKLEWLRKFLPYENGIPVDDTIARVMRKLNTKQFANCFTRWIQAVTEATNGDVIAIDGKTLRRSFNTKDEKSAIHMVSAWSTANGVVLGQEKTAEKSNEITAIPELLNSLAIKGCIITIDAMGCQKDIAEQIVKQKGDYLLALKGNQGNFHEEVVSFLTLAKEANFKNVEYDFYEEIDAGHGRIETRRAYAVDFKKYKKHIPEGLKWKKLTSVVMVETIREGRDFKTFDTRFYISSCEASAKPLLQASRKHWAVENSLHWTLDVTFREDESRIRKEAAPENYAIFRHIALNIIRRNISIDASVKRKRHMAALNDDVRTTLIKGLI
ncbi:MAG: ISAs1 family transposase [Tatlockia sp.]|nr:ISAs1 family transposase [Tatlockia sp.]